MYAIIREGNGKYYTSVVFGFFCKITANEDYQRYIERLHNQYFLVLNSEKNKLVRKYVYPREDAPYLDPKVLITDEQCDDWIILDEYWQGYAAFLSDLGRDLIENHEEQIPTEVLRKCVEIDAAYHFIAYPEVKSEQDIKNLICVAGGFHDGYIEKLERYDDTIYALFGGIWGCKLEFWFTGDASCQTESRDPEKWDPYWSCGVVLKDKGYFYLIDDEITVDEITSHYCWFRAKNLKYHIIPNSVNYKFINNNQYL